MNSISSASGTRIQRINLVMDEISKDRYAKLEKFMHIHKEWEELKKAEELALLAANDPDFVEKFIEDAKEDIRNGYDSEENMRNYLETSIKNGQPENLKKRREELFNAATEQIRSYYLSCAEKPNLVAQLTAVLFSIYATKKLLDTYIYYP